MIKDVKVISGCISCKNCENVCPKIFKVAPKSTVISDDYEDVSTEILQAELMCPVQVIKVQKTGSVSVSFQDAKVLSKTYLTPDTLEVKFQTKDFTFKPG